MNIGKRKIITNKYSKFSFFLKKGDKFFFLKNKAKPNKKILPLIKKLILEKK